jgi:hypothetical protein
MNNGNVVVDETDLLRFSVVLVDESCFSFGIVLIVIVDDERSALESS